LFLGDDMKEGLYIYKPRNYNCEKLQKNLVAHKWLYSDSVCGLSKYGGYDLKNYKFSNDLLGRKLCVYCAKNVKGKFNSYVTFKKERRAKRSDPQRRAVI